MAAPQITRFFATSVTVDGDIVTTVVALLDSGDMIYTGTSEGAEWHRLPPVPPLDEMD